MAETPNFSKLQTQYFTKLSTPNPKLQNFIPLHHFFPTFINFAINMLKTGVIIIFITGLLIFSGCKKDEVNWTYCTDCEISNWTGDYTGVGEYFNGKITVNLLTTISIENTSGNVLKTTINVEDVFSTNFVSTKNDNEYYYDVPGSNKSLNLTLSTKDSEYKLTGTAKLYHFEKDTLVIDQSISFDAFRTEADSSAIVF